ncbi:hypothetical protein [Glaesserella parasuis]|uniref:hypothetical protein n=1 Tax=Glaesserella parasuis TaxID=738 RepID=UPI001F435CBD|nr:hypothetical protein [Glaesserella parasuis]
MAFDLQVFNKQTQTALTEMVDQDIQNSMRHQQGLLFCKMYQRKGILISVLALKQLAV